MTDISLNLRCYQKLMRSSRPSIRRRRSWFLLIPKLEPEIDGLKMEYKAAPSAVAAMVTYMHAT